MGSNTPGGVQMKSFFLISMVAILTALFFLIGIPLLVFKFVEGDL